MTRHEVTVMLLGVIIVLLLSLAVWCLWRQLLDLAGIVIFLLDIIHRSGEVWTPT